MAAVAGEAFAGLSHEAGRYGVLAADAFGYVSRGKERALASGSVGARRGKGYWGTNLKREALSAMALISPYSRAYGVGTT